MTIVNAVRDMQKAMAKLPVAKTYVVHPETLREMENQIPDIHLLDIVTDRYINMGEMFEMDRPKFIKIEHVPILPLTHVAESYYMTSLEERMINSFAITPKEMGIVSAASCIWPCLDDPVYFKRYRSTLTLKQFIKRIRK